jgi:hypothetical protein
MYQSGSKKILEERTTWCNDPWRKWQCRKQLHPEPDIFRQVGRQRIRNLFGSGGELITHS